MRGPWIAWIRSRGISVTQLSFPKSFSLVLVAAAMPTLFGAAPAAEPLKYFRPAGAPVAVQASTSIAVVNSASFLPGISPGGLATIFGQNLTDVSGVIVPNSNPLPTQLANVNVLVNGVYAPIFSIAYAGGQDQISVQIPYGTNVGPGAAFIEVLDYGRTTGTARVDSFTEDPGIFAYNGNYAVGLLYPNYSLIGPSNPARPGDVVVLYTTGLGPLNQNLRDGYGAPYDPLAYTREPFQVLVNGQVCQVFFSGLGPGYVGLYQVNMILPNNLPRGNLTIQIVSPYANSNVAILPVQ